MSDLRAQLLEGASPSIPAYRMLVPPGWDVFDLGTDDEATVVKRVVSRLTAANRPDLAAVMSRHVHEALSSLRRQNAFAYAIAGEGAPTWIIGSASLVGMKRTATPELTLDDIVQNAIANHDGAPLAGDERIVRWSERRPVTMDGETVRTLMLNYMIPIPGSKRTQALHWVVNVAHPEDMPTDHPALAAWEALFDLHVATFAWGPR